MVKARVMMGSTLVPVVKVDTDVKGILNKCGVLSKKAKGSGVTNKFAYGGVLEPGDYCGNGLGDNQLFHGRIPEEDMWNHNKCERDGCKGLHHRPILESTITKKEYVEHWKDVQLMFPSIDESLGTEEAWQMMTIPRVVTVVAIELIDDEGESDKSW